MCDPGFGGDLAEVWNHEARRSAKPRRCDVCTGPIRKGEVHRYVSALFDGSWSHERICLACASDIDAFAHTHGYFPSAEAFVETLEECIDYGDDESNRTWGPMLQRIQAREFHALMRT